MADAFNLGSVVPKVYRKAVKSFLKDEYNEQVFKGGRGSVKSSVAALLSVLNVIDGRGSSVCIRRYAIGLKGSCFNDVLAVLRRLDVEGEFSVTTSPLQVTHVKTGYIIAFRGLDDPQKIKSLRSPVGQFTCLWFEECQEIEGYRKCRSVIQTVARGGKHCNILYSFNPLPSPRHWTHRELSLRVVKTRDVLHTTYLDVPAEWLGEQFFVIAEDLKKVDYEAYRNEYLGEACGSKGMIFPNVRPIEGVGDVCVDYVHRGNDFGFSKDPNCYVAWYYDKEQRVLVLKDASFDYGLSIKGLAEVIKMENVYGFDVRCDSADPRSISALQDEGVTAVGCRKGADSVRYGVKWLQGLKGIYIDKDKHPDVYREFSEYEYPMDKNDEYVSVYPDKDNHSIDATRYALEDVIRGFYD